MQRNNEAIVIISRPCSNNVFEREHINQISKVAKISHSYLIQLCCAILKYFLWWNILRCNILRWNWELLLAKILKSSRETTWLKKSIWSLIAEIVLAFDFFPGCSPALTKTGWRRPTILQKVFEATRIFKFLKNLRMFEYMNKIGSFVESLLAYVFSIFHCNCWTFFFFFWKGNRRRGP